MTTLWRTEAQTGDISRSGVQIPPTPFIFDDERTRGAEPVRSSASRLYGSPSNSWLRSQRRRANVSGAVRRGPPVAPHRDRCESFRYAVDTGPAATGETVTTIPLIVSVGSLSGIGRTASCGRTGKRFQLTLSIGCTTRAIRCDRSPDRSTWRALGRLGNPRPTVAVPSLTIGGLSRRS